MKGWKVWTGTIGYALCEGLKSIFPEYEATLSAIQNTVFIPLGAWGIGHKLDKARGY